MSRRTSRYAMLEAARFLAVCVAAGALCGVLWAAAVEALAALR
jgi:hypothetical protein